MGRFVCNKAFQPLRFFVHWRNVTIHCTPDKYCGTKKCFTRHCVSCTFFVSYTCRSDYTTNRVGCTLVVSSAFLITGYATGLPTSGCSPLFGVFIKSYLLYAARVLTVSTIQISPCSVSCFSKKFLLTFIWLKVKKVSTE